MQGHRGSRSRLAAGLLAGLLLAACSSTIGGQPQAVSSPGAGTSTGPAAAAAGVGSPSAVARFGYGPSAHAGVHYRPDVVLIGTGPDAIRGVSPDGVVWTMDDAAPGVRDLAVGKVMFASSVAVGRVVALTDVGGDRKVTLAPIELGDLVDHAVAAVDQDIEVSKMTAQAYPQGLAVESAKDGTFVKPSGYSFAGSVTDGRYLIENSYPWDPPKAGDQVSVNQWSVQPLHSASELGLDVSLRKADLVVGATVALQTSDLHLTMAGDPSNDFVAVLSGVKGLTLDFKAGMGPGADPASANRRLEAQVPISFSIPITGGIAPPGIPVYLKIGYTFTVITALGAKNATITGSADYGLDGDIGIRHGQVLSPTLTVKQSLITNIGGISLTASGLVVGVKMKIMLGVGIPMAMAGPYVSLTVASGIARGTQIAINPDCKFASLDVKAAAGVGTDVDSLVAAILQKYKITSPINVSRETSLLSIHREQTEPQVAACALG